MTTSHQLCSCATVHSTGLSEADERRWRKVQRRDTWQILRCVNMVILEISYWTRRRCRLSPHRCRRVTRHPCVALETVSPLKPCRLRTCGLTSPQAEMALLRRIL